LPLAFINGVIVYFAHVPKTGGSSIEAYLRSKGRVGLLQKETLGWSRCTAQHIERRIYAELMLDTFADTGFAVVRDPLERLKSEYRYRVDLSGGKRNGDATSARRKLRRILKTMVFRTGCGVPAGVLTFEEWVSQVFAAYPQNNYINDNHIRPQSEFIDPAHKLFRFEDGLDAVFDWIDATTNTVQMRRDHHVKKSSERGFPVSPETMRMIEDFYKDDYDVIGALDRPQPESRLVSGAP